MPKWFVRRALDGRFLCEDGLWRNFTSFGNRRQIKFYSSSNRAHKFGLRNQDGTAYAVYENDQVDACGQITRITR